MRTQEIKLTGWMVIIHIVMMLTAGVILIYTFDFPDILRENMETTLGLFHKNKTFTVPAYYLFTLTGISFMTIVLLLFKTLKFQKYLKKNQIGASTKIMRKVLTLTKLLMNS